MSIAILGDANVMFPTTRHGTPKTFEEIYNETNFTQELLIYFRYDELGSFELGKTFEYLNNVISTAEKYLPFDFNSGDFATTVKGNLPVEHREDFSDNELTIRPVLTIDQISTGSEFWAKFFEKLTIGIDLPGKEKKRKKRDKEKKEDKKEPYVRATDGGIQIFIPYKAALTILFSLLTLKAGTKETETIKPPPPTITNVYNIYIANDRIELNKMLQKQLHDAIKNSMPKLSEEEVNKIVNDIISRIPEDDKTANDFLNYIRKNQSISYFQVNNFIIKQSEETANE